MQRSEITERKVSGSRERSLGRAYVTSIKSYRVEGSLPGRWWNNYAPAKHRIVRVPRQRRRNFLIISAGKKQGRIHLGFGDLDLRLPNRDEPVSLELGKCFRSWSYRI